MRSQSKTKRSISTAEATTTTTTITKAATAVTRVGMIGFIFVWFLVTTFYVIRLQTWMILVGFCMILMSIMSALHEFTKPFESSIKKRKKSLCSFEEMRMEENPNGKSHHISSNNSTMTTSTVHVAQGIEGQTTPFNRIEVKRQVEKELPLTAMILSPIMEPKKQKEQNQQQQVIVNSVTAATTSSPVTVSSLVSTKVKATCLNTPQRRQDISSISTAVEVIASSSSSSLVVSKEKEEAVDKEEEVVLHCGTVIDLEGSHGYIIPYDLVTDSTNHHHIPLVVPFELESNTTPNTTVHEQKEENDEEASSIVIGKTVAFEMTTKSNGINSAINVCPASLKMNLDEEILKTRHALLTCKLAREQSFAKAMNQLKRIPPRHEPVELQVDLIQYAKRLDEGEEESSMD
jgi:hypothetical protein